jgi:serine/threonine-protein phosphatase 6 regulatory ankyrin repeat subunit A
MDTLGAELIQTICNGDIDGLNELLKTSNLSVNFQDDDGKSLIVCATLLGYKEIAQFLLENDADVNLQDEDGCTALHYASLVGHINIVELLLKYGANVNHQDNDGCTALICASKMNLSNIIELLIYNGADINIKDCKNRTAVQWSLIFRNNSDTTIILIKSGANIEDEDEDGETILIKAIKIRSLEIIDAIISVGANLNVKTEDNISALNLARIREIEYRKIAEKLEQAGALVLPD